MGRPASGKWRAEPRSEPDSGHPTVRDRRGALGDVTHGEPRNPTRKSKERLWSLLAYRCARPGSIPTTRTSGSVGGQGQQRPWSTRPDAEPGSRGLARRDLCLTPRTEPARRWRRSLPAHHQLDNARGLPRTRGDRPYSSSSGSAASSASPHPRTTFLRLVAMASIKPAPFLPWLPVVRTSSLASGAHDA